MANNNYSATAANILSSLGVKGISTTGGAGKDGKIPVIGDNGKLDTSLLSIEDIVAALDLPYLENTAFVNPREGVSGIETGAITSPFRSLTAAAASEKKFSNFILVSDTAYRYGREHIVFKTDESIIRIFSTGTAQFTSLELEWRADGTTFIINNLSVSDYLYFNSPYSCSVVLNGYGKVAKMRGKKDTDVSDSNVTEVKLGSEMSVTTFVDIDTVNFISPSSQVTNSSTLVKGKTVKDATDRLSQRRIRIPKFTNDSEGIHASTSEDVEAETDSSDDYELHDIREIGETLADAANSTFYKENDSPKFDKVAATSVVSNTITANDVSTSKLTLCGLPIYINTEDFLVIGDGEVTTSYYKVGGDLYFKSYVVSGIQHYVKQEIAHDDQIGWGANWTGDYIIVDGKFINIVTGRSDYTTDDPIEEYYRIGSDLYFKSRIVDGIQHYVKQSMGYDTSIGWGADWTGDYIIVDGEFVNVEDSSSSD